MRTTRSPITRRDSEAIKHIAGSLDMVADLLSKLNASSGRRAPRPGLDLSPQVERDFRKTHPRLLRKLKRAARGEASPEVRAFFRSCKDLRAKFLAASPTLDGKLLGRVVTYLVETVEYADKLGGRLREIKRVKGRTRREDLRSILGIIYDIEIAVLWRRIAGLRRDIPRLYEQLGGNPSEDLMLPCKRGERQ